MLDIGGHVGYFTLLLRKQVGVTGKVICFEPLAENRQILQENLKSNRLGANVLVEIMAVADQVIARYARVFWPGTHETKKEIPIYLNYSIGRV